MKTWLYRIATALVIVAVWQMAGGAIPTPRDVAASLATLWAERGLFDQLLASVALEARALLWSTVLALGAGYLTVLPAFRPAVTALTKLRFTGLVGWGFVLTLYAASGRQLEEWMLVFGIAPYFATAMVSAIADIPQQRFDHARTLGMPPWRVTWEVVVRGTADTALETLRQCAAMGWMMLTMVEGLVRSEGGIGVMMLDANKHLQLDAVFALIAVVLVVGVAQDFALMYLRRALCPYAKER